MNSVEQRFALPIVLPSFNDIERARAVRDRIFGNGYARLKYELQSAIVGYVRKAKLRPILPGVLVGFEWWERDRRRDPLDVRASCKFVLDALCEPDRAGDRQPRASVMHCDGWHCVRGVADTFEVSQALCGVIVTLYGVPREPRSAPVGWPFEVQRG